MPHERWLIIPGFQGVVFTACAKLFAITEGLLQLHRDLDVCGSYDSSLGLAVDLRLVAAGLATSLVGVHFWRQKSLGRLDYASTKRIVTLVSR